MAYKILAVDDEPDTLELLRTIFEAEGFIISTAINGKSCIEMVEKFRPDIILLDIMMPSMNGWIVYLNLQKDVETKKIPIIILSAKTLTDESKEKIQQLGIKDYIMKPFDVTDIVNRVKKVLEPEKK
jgi:DNA-binding response OmpR family regulator